MATKFAEEPPKIAKIYPWGSLSALIEGISSPPSIEEFSHGNRHSKAKSEIRQANQDHASRYIGKPAGVIQARIQEAGPEHFAVISVDCAKALSVWMAGVYHRPVQAARRKAGFDTRTVHPFASKHDREPLHPNSKTDDYDLEAIWNSLLRSDVDLNRSVTF